MNWVRRHVRPEQIRELSLFMLIIVAVLVFGSLIDGYYSFRTFNRIASSVRPPMRIARASPFGRPLSISPSPNSQAAISRK